jgi:hypothetical protein
LWGAPGPPHLMGGGLGPPYMILQPFHG